MGQVDPLWAVLTDPNRRHGKWDVDEFMATAAGPVGMVRKLVERAGLSLGDRVLDFGCGVGRLSNALAEHASEVVGIDIAESMVANAVKYNRHPDRVRFVHYDGVRLPFPDESFDSVVSLIVLQHARPEVQMACLLELRRIVRPGGALVLQIPSRPHKPEPLSEDGMRSLIEILDAPGEVVAGRETLIRTRVTNTGSRKWLQGQQIRLGNHWLDAGGEPLRWNDGRGDLEHDVLPGDSAEIELVVTPPAVAGPAILEFDMVQEAVNWWAKAGNKTTRVDVHIAEPKIVPAPNGESPSEPSEELDTTKALTHKPGKMEMHGLAVPLVRSLFNHCGCDVIDVVPDTMAGDDWESFTYVIRRNEPI
ncbi:class I SAM-dependent methyltransferase [Herbihabitans rhizosphaerae]|uniref:class I SAM-dependent methyltransferase n=1 Tax=Herbihabitans rhizosphaerae TaxID=1872711 RepID=UPI0013EE845E|nr:class I SAM-dependent methyltransferase [Herbihabitans rhizosphaerae]